jgi:restriction system protein
MKAAEHRRILEEADQLQRSLLAVYLSRKNQLIHCRWPEMTGVDFENFLASVFQELGYEVRTTGVTGNQGADLIVSKHGRKVAIQAKGYPRSTVGNEAVQEADTGMISANCQAAAVITNSDFTSSARELAAKVGCRLVAGHQMRDLIEGRITL